MLQGAEGGFTACPPLQQASEPALLLPLGALLRQTSPRRQPHLLHSHLFRLPLMLRREETPIPRRPLRPLAETPSGVFHGGHQRVRVGRVARQHFILTDHPLFYFIDPHPPAKLVGLRRFGSPPCAAQKQQLTHHFQLPSFPFLHDLLGLPHHAAG